MINKSVADAFREIADLLELQGANPFRIRAYRTGAQTVEVYYKDVAPLTLEQLEAIRGIGKDLAAKIHEYAETGTMLSLEKLRKEVPKGLWEMMQIPGLGPKMVKRFYEELGIKNVKQLVQMASEGKLEVLPGIKERTEENILRGVAILETQERKPLAKVQSIAEKLLEKVRAIPKVERAEIAGSLRRKKSTVRDIDLLVVSVDPINVIKKFVQLPEIKFILAEGDTKASVILKSPIIQVDLRVVPKKYFGAAWHYFTGSKAHNVRLRKIAHDKGWKVNEYGVFRLSDGEQIAGETEEGIYQLFGMEWVPPEKRE